MPYNLSHLDTLESESIHILREVASELARPALLFSGGKDSIVMLRLAEKAFRPARFPFPLLHVDTGHNFPEVLAYRDERTSQLGERLLIASVEESIRRGTAVEPTGVEATRNRLCKPVYDVTLKMARGEADPMNFLALGPALQAQMPVAV